LIDEMTQTELIRLKDQAESANKAKSEFLANMSHEIRTLMNSVIGFGDLLKNTTLDIQQKEYVDAIYESGNLLISLVNDILDMSKIESSKLTLEEMDFSLESLIVGILKILRQKVGVKPVELTVFYPETVPESFKGDPLRIRQIFMNLIDNAIKFTDEGDVTVIVSIEDVNADDGRENANLKFFIRDTGIGIRQDDRDRIFSGFSQADSTISRKFGGTGLGLSISKMLVEMMGGHISVVSEPGKGSEFKFSLRLKNCTFPVQYQQTTGAFENLKGKTVLIVDDNTRSREILERHCLAFGMTVINSLGSAETALSWLDKTDPPPDIIFSDILMPVMDGFAFVKKIRHVRRLKCAICVSLSSDALPVNPNSFDNGGFNGNLVKPFTRSELGHILQSIACDPVKEQNRTTMPQQREGVSTKGALILLVEDNILNQKLMTILLNKMECIVEIANNGHEAVLKAAAKNYDVILMDIQMPIMDGLEATELLRDRMKVKTPIIALTAKVFKEDDEKCMAVGMNDFLTKPVEIKALKEKIIKWTNK
jgi:two-component system, sensor histidine kinase and response regulator